jgi:hypothetical protein
MKQLGIFNIEGENPVESASSIESIKLPGMSRIEVDEKKSEETTV